MSAILSKQDLFLSQAPLFNFELDADQLLAKALEVGFVTKVRDDQYLLNENYGVKYCPNYPNDIVLPDENGMCSLCGKHEA
jgi:hypothetical protein